MNKLLLNWENRLNMASKLRYTVVVCILLVLFMNCTTPKKNDFFTIDIDSAKDQTLSLSEIADNIEAIELEMTDNSLINGISGIRLAGDYIVVYESRSIFLFDKTGKFVRKIGSVGQGPGEFLYIRNVATDIKNTSLFVLCRMSGKIICYDFEGKVIKESSPDYRKGVENRISINSENGDLLYITEKQETENGEHVNISLLYTIDENLLITDSIEIRKRYSRLYGATGGGSYSECVFNDGESTYLYFGDPTSDPVIIDTLYQLKNNQLIPYLNLNFRNRGLDAAGGKMITILTIYKSSRYVFSRYGDDSQEKAYDICYDIKTGVCYKQLGGFLDDIHTGEKVRIRQIPSDSNMFYYSHTQIDDSAKDEPNPTLYIGTLKK